LVTLDGEDGGLVSGAGEAAVAPPADSGLRAALEKAERVKASRRTPFGPAMKREFLRLLAEGCDVKAICGHFDLLPATVYNHRRADAQFAADWALALEVRYGHLMDRLVQIGRDGPVSEMSTVRACEVVLRATSPEWAPKPPAATNGGFGKGNAGRRGERKPVGTIRVTIGQPLVD
jgi:hypothetical protein